LLALPFLLLPLLLAWPAAAQIRSSHSAATAAGRPAVILSNWTCWFGDCRFANCRMTTVRAPRGGTVVPRLTRTVIPANGGACAGRPTTGLSVEYRPRGNFRGTDRLAIAIRADNGGHYVRAYEVDVR
jgi:hypothetical protein